MASQIEKKLDTALENAGFTPGVTAFTFTEDGKFTQTTKGRTLSGTYELNGKKARSP